MKPPPRLSIPTAVEVHRLLHQLPVHEYSAYEVSLFLRQLQESYPNSQLLVSQFVDLIETSCHTGTRSRIVGAIAILERLDYPNPNRRYLLWLLGGPTGQESFYLPDASMSIGWSNSGWSACAGTPGRCNACYVVPSSMHAVGAQFLHALLHGPSVTFPAPLTEKERRVRAGTARLLSLAFLRCQHANRDRAGADILCN